MADNHFRINRGISLVPQSGAPSNPSNGDIYYDNSLTKFRKYENGAWSDLDTTAGSSTPTVTVTAGENLSTNDAVYISDGTGADTGRTAGRAYKLDATNASRIQYLGLATAAISSGASGSIQISSELTGFTGLTAGAPLYGSITTPGSYTQVRPSTIGYYIIQLAIATTSTAVVVNGAGSATNQPVLTFLTATSATKTPGASDNYHALSGNSLTLTPGIWRVFGSARFGNNGSNPGYSEINATWAAANGADTSTPPSYISSASNLTMVSSNFPGPAPYGNPIGVGQNTITVDTVVVQVTASVTIYLVTYSVEVTASNARVIAYLNAEKLE